MGPRWGKQPCADFRTLCALVARMAGGVWLNLGSAVVMPEVFLKAVSIARNLGRSLDGLTTANLDFDQKYRGLLNVLERPGAEGIALTGHHEILIPLLHAAVLARLAIPAAKGATAGAVRDRGEWRSAMKIAVFCPNLIGDTVMATPTFRAFRSGFPDATIAGVIKARVMPTARGNALVRRADPARSPFQRPEPADHAGRPPVAPRPVRRGCHLAEHVPFRLDGLAGADPAPDRLRPIRSRDLVD